MVTGIIRSLNLEKGYGFITGEDRVDRFFHRSAVVGGRFEQLEKDQRVTFRDEEGNRGPRASEVQAA